MNIALWVAQGFAALVFLLTGALKVVAPKEKLAQKMHWAATWPPARIKMLGLAELAGACSRWRCTSRRCSRRSQRCA
jgi:uncharacterized protein YjeT (DUF2065 family)